MRAISFARHSAMSTLVFGAALAWIRLAGDRRAPIVALVAVALVAGVMLEMYRWKRGRYRDQVDREQVQMIATITTLIWVIGFVIDLRSPDRGALVVGGSIAAAAVIYTYSFLPYHRGI
ncbi:MAG TPA: hypothetical protein VGM77_02590 [Gemmatimonadales bacterium]|jgi:hypothetical protein